MSLKNALHNLFCCHLCTCESLSFTVGNTAFLGYPLPFISEHILLALSLFRCHLCRDGTHSLLVTLLETVQTAELSHLSNTGVESCGGAPPASKVYNSVLSPLLWLIQEEADVALFFAYSPNFVWERWIHTSVFIVLEKKVLSSALQLCSACFYFILTIAVLDVANDAAASIIDHAPWGSDFSSVCGLID